MWYIHIMGLLSLIKRISVICDNMDEPEGYYAK